MFLNCIKEFFKNLHSLDDNIGVGKMNWELGGELMALLHFYLIAIKSFIWAKYYELRLKFQINFINEFASIKINEFR